MEKHVGVVSIRLRFRQLMEFVSVRHANLGTAVQVEVPKAEFSRWTVKHLREIVCFKFDLEISPDYILALDGKILQDYMYINEHVKNDCIVTFTPVKREITNSRWC